MINRFDQELREMIKRIFHLPLCTISGLMFRGKRDGGEDIPKLENGR
jgi:hypothetical protein